MTDLAPHAYAEDARNPFGAGRGEAQSYTFDLTLGTANLTINSNFPLFKCAKDCWITDPWMTYTDMDTNGTPTLTFDLGTDTDDNSIMAAVAAGAGAGTSIAAVGTQVAVAAGETISASVLAAAATAAAGSLTVGFTVRNK